MSMISIRQVGPVALEATTAHGKVRVDLPAESGGAANGATPTELLAVSLAACKMVTALIYAGRKGLKFESLAADVDFDMAQGPTRIGAIRIHVRGFGNQMDVAQRQRIMAAMEACHVAHTLQQPPTVELTIE